MLARISALAALLAVSGLQLPAPPPPLTPIPRIPDVLNTVRVPTSTKSPSNASYRIEATLDPRQRILTGNQTLTWRNISANAANTLQFHLYYNAWRDDRSSWMREVALAGFDVRLDQEHRSSIDVTRLQIARSDVVTDLTARMRFIAPDDGNPDDRTVLEVPLDRPVAAGEEINVSVEWTSKIPRPVARTGAVGDFFFLGHWFPKIGVLEDSGWNCHQFHATTEFYADFGVYDVALRVPRGWVVGATGRERSRTDGPNSSTTHRYYAEDVHDFAWTTSPDFVERRDRFEHPSLPEVDIRLLLQPEHTGQAQRHFEATRAALKHFGEWFGPYPYGHITIVDPAYESGTGGMEYPTLLTTRTRWIAPRHATDPEDVTIHEVGHQFWHGIVATNEFEHAWMDEGLVTFATARVMQQAFSPNFHVERYFGGFIPWVFRGLHVPRGAQERATLSRARGDEPSRESWRYWPSAAGAISYSRTALALHTLEKMLGWETLQRGMSSYFARYAFKHPRPEDFFSVMNEASGQDLTWFFDQVFRSSKTFDYSLELLRSERHERGFGTTVVARRVGEAVFPVDIRVVFEDGQEQGWRWDGRDRWKRFVTEHPVAAAYAHVDPYGVLQLDENRTNNSYSLHAQPPDVARKWSLAWLIWLQDHLLTYGLFI